MNQFRGYDESAELLDHYFGENHQSMQTAAAISLLFYAFSLLLTLFFLQPRRSRLRVLRETRVSRGALSFLAQDAVGGVGRESDEESEFESEGWWTSRRHMKDSSLSAVESKRNEEGPSYNPKENRGRSEGGGGGGGGSEKVESGFLVF